MLVILFVLRLALANLKFDFLLRPETLWLNTAIQEEGEVFPPTFCPPHLWYVPSVWELYISSLG